MQSHRRELRRPRSSNSSAAARGAPFRAASSVYSAPLSSRSAASLSSRSSRSGRGRQRSTFARTGQGLLTQRERQRTGAGAPQRFTFDLRKAIKAAEERVDSEIKAAYDHSQAVVNMAAQRVAAEDALYTEQEAMRSRTDEGASKYLQAIVKKSEVLGEMQAERGVLKLDVEEHLPYWMVRWTAFTKWLVGIAHTHGWRVEAKGVLQEMVDFFTRDGKTEVLPELREMEANINAWPPSKFKRVMDAIKQHAHQLELARPSAYTTAHERLKACDDRIKRKTEELDATIHGHAASTELDKNASLTRKFEHSQAMLETMAPATADGSGVPPPTISSHIARFVTVASGRMTPTAMRKEFHEMLAFCAAEGAWQDAFKVYGAMLQCRVPPEDMTYKSMIAACKHATPVNSAAAVAVLAEMRRRGHPLKATMFNRAIDACRLSGAWRRGLTVFQAMVEAGCQPSTATYQALGEACAKAPIEDAPDVYAAMKYSGVPELLSYTASMKAIHGDHTIPSNTKPKRKLGDSVPRRGRRARSEGAATNSRGSGSSWGKSLSTRDSGDIEDMMATTAPFGAVGLGGKCRLAGARRSKASLGRRAVSPIAGAGGTLGQRSFEWRSGTLLGLGDIHVSR